MKRLLLAAFLLTAGSFTSENVIANAPSKQNEFKKAPQPPAAVLQAFAADVVQFESFGDIQVTNVTWSFNKGKFTASFNFYHPATGELEGPYNNTYNRQGDQL